MKKRAQSAIEFMILLLFMLIVVSLAVFVVGQLSIDLRDSQNAQERDEFADFIVSEFELAQNVDGGYIRLVPVERHYVERFNVSFNGSYLIMQDFLVEGENSRSFFYEIPGDVKYNYTINSMTGRGILTIRNERRPQADILEINSSRSFVISS